MKCDPEALKIDPHGCIAQLIKIIDITLRLQIKLHKALFDERRLKVVQNMECEHGSLGDKPTRVHSAIVFGQHPVAAIKKRTQPFSLLRCFCCFFIFAIIRNSFINRKITAPLLLAVKQVKTNLCVAEM